MISKIIIISKRLKMNLKLKKKRLKISNRAVRRLEMHRMKWSI